LQRAFGDIAVGVADIGATGGQLEAKGGAEEIEALRIDALGAPLAAAENPRVTKVTEVPRLEQVLSHVMVDV
jgi:hypothetical protein